MKYILLLLYVFLSGGSLLGQNEITGYVIDSIGPMEGATVVVLDEKDSTMLAFGLTNEDGLFRVKEVVNGQHILLLAYTGYGDVSLLINIDDTKLDLGIIEMVQSSSVLPVVQVNAEHIPLGINGDTLNYNVAAFATLPGESVEDLLRKLPGIEIARDGSIKAQGEDVQNVLVDGKEFFSGDPQMATKNLEASALEKVQVFDKKSEEAEFTGIDDGNEERSINLKLKEGYKNGGFGNVEAHGGTNSTHNLKLNYHRFSPKSQVSVLANKNNINENAFSFQDYVQFMGGLSNMIQSGGLQSFGSSMFSQGNRVEEGRSDKTSIGTNLNLDFNKKIKWYSNYFLASDTKNIDKSIYANNFSNQFNYLSFDTTKLTNSGLNHRFNSKLTYKLNATNELSIRGKASYFNTDIRELQRKSYIHDGILNSRTINNISSSGSKFDYDINAIYKMKFEKNGRNWINNFSISKTQEHEDLKLDNSLATNDSVWLIDQFQEFNNRPTTINLGTKFTEPLGSKYYMGIGFKKKDERNTPQKEYYNIVNEFKLKDFDFSGDFNRKWIENSVSISIRNNRKKIKMNASLNIMKANLLASSSQSANEAKFSKNYYLPYAKIEFDLKGAQRLVLSYNTMVNAPSLTDLITFPNNLNINVLKLGNPNLEPEVVRNFRLQYNYYNEFNFTSFFINLNLNRSNNKIINATNIHPDFTIVSQPINTTNYSSFSGHLNHSNPIRPLKIKYDLSISYMYNSYDNRLNDIENSVTNKDITIDFRVENRKKGKLDLALGAKMNRSIHQNSISKNFDQTFEIYDLYSDIEINIKKRVIFGMIYDRRFYNKSSFSTGVQQNILSVYSRVFALNNNMTIKIKAVDILDQNSGIDRFSTNTSIEESKFNTLGRYYMIGLSYKIGKVKPK